MFSIFKKQNKMKTIKDVFGPVLDEMWMCRFDFYPWDGSRFNVQVKKVHITEARADEDGIWVKSDYWKDGSNSWVSGYIDKIMGFAHGWVGFFETEEAAKKAFDDLMSKWMVEMKGKMFN